MNGTTVRRWLGQAFIINGLLAAGSYYLQPLGEVWGILFVLAVIVQGWLATAGVAALLEAVADD